MKKIFRTGMSLLLSLSMTLAAAPVLALAAETDDSEFAGSLTENFDGLTSIDELYNKHVDAGVLSGAWQRSTRGTGGSATAVDGTVSIQANGAENSGDWNTFSGLDFVFDTPLSPDYIVEVSYEVSGGRGSVFFNNLSETEGSIENINSAGATVWDGGFQFIKANENYSPATISDCYLWQGDSKASVKVVYNLRDWTYDGTVNIGEASKTVTMQPIAPAAYNDNNGSFVSIPDSSYNRLTLAVCKDTSTFDNISIKARRIEDNSMPEQNMELAGELNERFTERADIDKLYGASGSGVLSGTWQRSTRGTGGSVAVNGGKMSVTAPDNADWTTFSGVDFVFNEPLTPDYIVEVSYKLSGTGTGSVFFNNLSSSDAAMTAVNSIGAAFFDTYGIQLLKTKEDDSTAGGTWVGRTDNVFVNTEYNLYNWKYDGTILTTGGGNGKVSANAIGPADYNDESRKGTFICTPQSTYDRLTFAVCSGTSSFDNISVKAYKFKDNIEPQMTESFTGKTAGAVADTKAESGYGKWVANTAWGSGFEYVAYTKADGQEDIGIRASAEQSYLQYVPGMNLSRMYEKDNSEITVGFDFITPNVSERKPGWMIMEWGDGFTGKYRNIPFFAIIASEDGYKFARCSGDVNGTADNFGKEFVGLEKNTAYTFEAKIYPATEMTYATIKKGENVIYSGFYRMGQWRSWTPGHNIHTMSITEKWNTGGIILDNFTMSAREFTVQEPLGRTLDFNEFSNDGFLETIYWGAAAKIASAPSNGETDMGKALNVVGEAEGVALPYFAEPVTEGVYRYTAMLYNKNLDVTEDESEVKENSRSRVMIDAPKDAAGFTGSLTLALLENNAVSLGKEDKIAVAPNEWINVETIIDLNNKKTYLAVYDKDGTRLGIISSDFFANDSTEETQYTIDSLSSIRIRNWNGEMLIDSVIDNMKLERLDGGIGFTKDNNVVNSAAVGDNLGLSFVLADAPDEASSETCIIAYYDADGNKLMSVDIPTFTINSDSIFCVCNGLSTVPAGAATAKAFIWDMSSLKSLAESAMLPIVTAK